MPALPSVNTASFQPAVRQAIDEALSNVHSRPKDARANGHLGMVLQAHEQWTAASDAYLRAETLDAKEFDWPYYLGIVYSQVGHFDDSRAALVRALAIDESNEPARLKLADALLSAGHATEAARHLDRLLKQSSSNASAWYAAGRARIAVGDTAGGIQAFEEACRLYPTFGGARYALALALRKTGRSDEAVTHLKIYEKDKTTAPPQPDARMDAIEQLNAGATGLIRRGIELEQSGRIAEAIVAHEAAAKADPKNEQVYINMIQLYGRAGDLVQAEASYRTAIGINPKRAEAHYNFGVLLFNQKRFADAIAAFERALVLNPGHGAAHHNLGVLFEQSGRLRDAARHYELAIAADPGYRLAHFHLGRILVSRQNYPAAIAHFEKAAEPDDDQSPGYLYALGAALARSGDRKGAIVRLEAARSRAQAHNQLQLASSIQRDLQVLGGAKQ